MEYLYHTQKNTVSKFITCTTRKYVIVKQLPCIPFCALDCFALNLSGTLFMCNK